MAVELDKIQLKAIEELSNGKILCGGVGSGKSRTALAYFYTKVCDGDLRINGFGGLRDMSKPRDVYIITTARKRNDLDWEKEAVSFGISTNRETSVYGIQLKVDSWNNITNYQDVKDAFFIFDEQRLVGNGTWVKAFYKIVEHNQWIMASATPGDHWMDYLPVFVANGFYKSRREFIQTHVIYKPFRNFPQIDRFIETARLEKYRRQLLVDMPVPRHTTRHIQNVTVDNDKQLFHRVYKERWNIYEDRPIRDVAELFRVMRKLVNSDKSRVLALDGIQKKHNRVVVFYNFNYELDILREYCIKAGLPYAEWNGQNHDQIPTGDNWLYLVQYTAGAEGWNCVETDCTVFYSLNYSYKINEQSKGRIDRRNTRYRDLWYYVFWSNTIIDRAIMRSLANKTSFNEQEFLNRGR